jgi:hypothetical protein
MPNLQRAPVQVVQTPATDSRRWEAFQPRDGDVVIATFAKCGTTWMQRIVDLLVFQSPDVRQFGEMSPWLDATIFNPLEDDLATLEAQTHRRYIKSHLPFDALPLWDTVKYIHVGRDGRDQRLSWQNHEQGFRPEFMARIASNAMALAAQQGAARPVRLRPHRRIQGRTCCNGSTASKRRSTGRAAQLQRSLASRPPTGASVTGQTCCSRTTTT